MGQCRTWWFREDERGLGWKSEIACARAQEAGRTQSAVRLRMVMGTRPVLIYAHALLGDPNS